MIGGQAGEGSIKDTAGRVPLIADGIAIDGVTGMPVPIRDFAGKAIAAAGAGFLIYAE